MIMIIIKTVKKFLISIIKNLSKFGIFYFLLANLMLKLAKN
jgi:hypothetical protein